MRSRVLGVAGPRGSVDTVVCVSGVSGVVVVVSGVQLVVIAAELTEPSFTDAVFPSLRMLRVLDTRLAVLERLHDLQTGVTSWGCNRARYVSYKPRLIRCGADNSVNVGMCDELHTWEEEKPESDSVTI